MPNAEPRTVVKTIKARVAGRAWTKVGRNDQTLEMSYETICFFSFLYPYRIRKLGLCAPSSILFLFIYITEDIFTEIFFRQFSKCPIFFQFFDDLCCMLPQIFRFSYPYGSMGKLEFLCRQTSSVCPHIGGKNHLYL